MILLSELTNHSSTKRKKRLGRGTSSGVGKTCGRGQKGDGSRSGYKRRHGKIGGAMPLHMKVPIRGFSRARFKREVFTLSLDKINAMFNDGETVSIETLVEKKIISKNMNPYFKILSYGEITKKIEKIKANGFSEKAQKKLEDKSIPCEIV